MTLYDRVGGDDAIAAAVDGFYERIVTDPTLSGWFEGIDLASLKGHQRAFLAVGLDGPEHYDGRSMRNAHSGLAITNDAFTTMLGHLSDTLRDLGVDPDVLRQIVRRIELMRAAIVTAR